MVRLDTSKLPPSINRGDARGIRTVTMQEPSDLGICALNVYTVGFLFAINIASCRTSCIMDPFTSPLLVLVHQDVEFFDRVFQVSAYHSVPILYEILRRRRPMERIFLLSISQHHSLD